MTSVAASCIVKRGRNTAVDFTQTAIRVPRNNRLLQSTGSLWDFKFSRPRVWSSDVFWDVLPCKNNCRPTFQRQHVPLKRRSTIILQIALMMEAARTSETARQYIPEDKSELHTGPLFALCRREENALRINTLETSWSCRTQGNHAIHAQIWMESFNGDNISLGRPRSDVPKLL
jgi:hypothetical protein